MITTLIQNGTNNNGTYEITRIERVCETIIASDVTKHECDEEGGHARQEDVHINLW